MSGVLFFGAQLALAVQHIQDYGIIHRDIKPENCLVRDNGYLLLSDFGMATIVQSADAPLRKFVGTPKVRLFKIVTHASLYCSTV